MEPPIKRRRLSNTTMLSTVGAATSLQAARLTDSLESDDAEPSPSTAATSRHDSASSPLQSRGCIQVPSLHDAIELLRTLPLRADSGVRYAHGKYVVRRATRWGADVPHCATRIDTIAQLESNVTSTLRLLGKTAADLATGHYSPLEGGMVAMRQLIAFHNRRLALLKEFELITSAQVLMRHLECNGILVSNTQLLLNRVGVATVPDVSKMSPSQRKMIEFAMRYGGTSSQRPTTDLRACNDQLQSWEKFMVDYAKLWFEEHDHLSDRRTPH